MRIASSHLILFSSSVARVLYEKLYIAGPAGRVPQGVPTEISDRVRRRLVLLGVNYCFLDDLELSKTCLMTTCSF